MNPVRRVSGVIKRSIVITGHKTSVSLEDPFWNTLKDFAKAEGATVSDYIQNIDQLRSNGNLSSVLRVHILEKVAAELAHVKSVYDHDSYGVAPGLTITAKTTTSLPSNDFAQG